MNFREQYFDVWSQAWQFHKRFADMKGTDEEWESVIDMAGKTVEKFRDKPGYDFSKSLILATIDELEHQDKIKRKEHGKGE